MTRLYSELLTDRRVYTALRQYTRIYLEASSDEGGLDRPSLLYRVANLLDWAAPRDPPRVVGDP